MLEYSDQGSLVARDAIRIVARSSQSFGEVAVDRFLREDQEQHRLRQEIRSSRQNAVPPEQQTVLRSPVERTVFWVYPNGECAGLEISLAERQADFTAPAGRRAAFFEVTVDRKGAVQAVEPLYSDAPGLIEEMAGFVRENIRLSGASSESPAHQAFLVLTVDTEGRVGYLVGPGKELL